MSAPLQDTLARPMSDLRISVTDRCNFRCTFCMPAERKYEFLPKPEILSFEEVTRLVRLCLELGVEKVRLTGGEPLLRSELEHLIASLAALPGLQDLALTTNACLLPQKAGLLREAGLRRVTVSLHSLDPAVFGRLSGLDIDLERVLEGIRSSVRAGLTPIKLNVVVMQGVNDHEVVDLARFGREHGCVVRYIEYMDVGTVNAWDPSKVVSAQEIVERVDAVFPLAPMGKLRPGDVALRYRFTDGGGEIGVIPSVTQPFCGACTRIRLSAEGKLYTCLFAARGHDLRSRLRDGASDDELRESLSQIWRQRTDRYSEERTAALRSGRFVPAEKIEMFRIGG